MARFFLSLEASTVFAAPDFRDLTTRIGGGVRLASHTRTRHCRKPGNPSLPELAPHALTIQTEETRRVQGACVSSTVLATQRPFLAESSGFRK